MNYAIEESIVDAFVSYLGPKLSSASCVAAPSAESREYPLVVCRVAALNTLVPGVSWHDVVKAVIEIGILSETADEIDTAGKVITRARTIHANLRSEVLNALTIKDSAALPDGLAAMAQAQDLPKGLAAHLTAQRIPGVWIQSAQPGTPLATMSVDEEHRCLVTLISVSVIAQAIEIT